CDFAVGKVHDPMVGNGDAMRVAGQIVTNMFRSAEWWLRINYPVLTEQGSKKGVKRFSSREHFHATGKRQLSGMESALQAGDEPSAENSAQHFYRQEESVARVNPVLMIGSETAGRNYAMNMRMDLQILSPGVQDAEEADLCAQVLRVGCDVKECCSADAKEEIIDDLLVLQSQPGKFVRNGEDYMHVFYGQQFFVAIGQPLIAGIGLALRTMSRPAGVE
ncbi:MAG TPA: hypothetical protein VGN16_07590, partial [Acidobacteriaceae bacterium]